MDEEGRIRSERKGRQRMAACEDSGNERRAEREQEQEEPDRAELGENLEVEVVRVPNLVLERAVLVPVLLVGSGARSEERVVAVVVPGDLPELRRGSSPRT